MKNIKVTVGVEFTNGAKIALTPEQNNKVTDFVGGLLFSEKTTTKRVYTRRNGKREWTAEEDELVKKAMVLPAGKTRSNEYKKIRNQFRRTQQAVSQRATTLRRQKEKDLIETINNFDFLSR